MTPSPGCAPRTTSPAGKSKCAAKNKETRNCQKWSLSESGRDKDAAEGMETGPDVASSPSYSVGEGENNIAESAITAEEEGIRVGGKKRRRGADSLFPESRADRPAGGPGRKLHGATVLSFSFLCFLSSFSPERQFPNRKTKNGRHTRQFLLLKNESVRL